LLTANKKPDRRPIGFFIGCFLWFFLSNFINFINYRIGGIADRINMATFSVFNTAGKKLFSGSEYACKMFSAKHCAKHNTSNLAMSRSGNKIALPQVIAENRTAKPIAVAKTFSLKMRDLGAIAQEMKHIISYGKGIEYLDQNYATMDDHDREIILVRFLGFHKPDRGFKLVLSGQYAIAMGTHEEISQMYRDRNSKPIKIKVNKIDLCFDRADLSILSPAGEPIAPLKPPTGAIATDKTYTMECGDREVTGTLAECRRAYRQELAAIGEKAIAHKNHEEIHRIVVSLPRTAKKTGKTTYFTKVLFEGTLAECRVNYAKHSLAYREKGKIGYPAIVDIKDLDGAIVAPHPYL
jgi:hypothetical protein